MKLYTSYFGKLQTINSNPNLIIKPISISLYPPKWYSGSEYRLLAPTKEILDAWHQNHDIKSYVMSYLYEVLAKLDVRQTYNTIMDIGKGADVALLCYEVTGQFCHRHIVKDWFRRNGYECSELIL